MFACMDAPMEMYHVHNLSHPGEKNRLSALASFPKLVQFQIHPPLNIINIPDRLNVKFHYFLIGPKVKNFYTLTPLALIYVMLSPVS
jgi:hypothetical protein